MSLPKLKQVFPKILTWFEKNQRQGLPWRKAHREPYEVWVSEIMLQQTQVSRVIPFYQKFLKRFPTVDLLAKASWEEFLPYYQGLGYYSRGRNMLKTAQQVVTQHKGIFPKQKAQLIALPGIGEYTANAILSFAYNRPVLTFDTNHQRVWGRVLYGNKRAEIPKKIILEHLPKNTSSAKINEAFMDFANMLCLNSNPHCDICPLKMQCEYNLTHGKKELTVVKTKSAFATRSAQVFLILHQANKIFYSKNKKKFAPFVLSPSINSRAEIKKYFQKKYNLSLSVRPPFKKLTVNDKPTLFVRAQVLLGTPQFTHHSKPAYQTWLKQTA